MWICCVSDVRNEAEYPSFVEKVRSQVGDNGLNMLINNAGILLRRDNVENITRAEMLDHFETNTVAPLLITQVSHDCAENRKATQRIYWWLCARLQKLQCFSIGVTAVFH